LAAAAESQSLLSSSLRMIWGLLIVLGILFIIYIIVKKRFSIVPGGGRGVIKVIEAHHLMPRKSLYLIEVRGKEYLVGTGGDSLQLITKIDGADAAKPFDEILETSLQTQSA
jgi:flagellar protein FliO/FliZ